MAEAVQLSAADNAGLRGRMVWLSYPQTACRVEDVQAMVVVSLERHYVRHVAITARDA